MTLLLDTHVLLWYSISPEKIPEKTLSMLRNSENQIYISSMTAWEISIKYNLGKLPEAKSLFENYSQRLAEYSFSELPFYTHQALLAGRLESTHKDPFDRALAAQALSHKLTVVSQDEAFKTFSELNTLWGYL
jgi:PIN domain nuclease of toxin-antitoxin system